jgi:hypothetical protein
VSKTALPLNGLTMAHARASLKSGVKDSFTFRVGVSRFSNTVYCFVDMSTTGDNSKVEIGLVAHIETSVGKVLAELPNDELLKAISDGYLQHILFDAGAAALRQLVAIIASSIQVPTGTIDPEYYFLDVAQIQPSPSEPTS